ncbi:hypothetical protein [Nonomuraea insulae]|uniref:Uncharacterized protein n=1 Tax=Nonomuraea insulae TaxID=1616787 RepID=A0ABW1CCU0_9ACTN
MPEYEDATGIWREALIKLPVRLKGRPAMEPVAMASTNEAVMITDRHARPTFHSYDLRTRRSRALGTAPKWAQCNDCFEIKSVAVSRTRIVWTAAIYRSEPWNAGHRHVELWTMPRAGGAMRLVTWLTGHGDVPFEDELSLSGDDALWRGREHAYRVPLGGGPAQALPQVAPPPAALRDLDGTRCGREWCAGLLPPRLHELTKVVVVRRDGTGRREVVASDGWPLMNDRFGLFAAPDVNDHSERSYTAAHPLPQPLLYDRCTGKSGRVGGLPKGSATYQVLRGGQSATSPEEPLLYWKSRDGRSWTVLDLSRIPDSACT